MISIESTDFLPPHHVRVEPHSGRFVEHKLFLQLPSQSWSGTERYSIMGCKKIKVPYGGIDQRTEPRASASGRSAHTPIVNAVRATCSRDL